MVVIANRIVSGKQLISVNKIQEIEVIDSVVMGVDCSTTCTGVTIYSVAKKEPIYTFACKRSDNELAVRYKVYLKSFMTALILQIKSKLSDIYYEEPFVGQYVESSMTLISMRTFIPEILIENEDKLNRVIEFHEVNNKSWKRDLLDGKVPSSTELEKKAIADKINKLYSCYKELTQDEHDSLGIAMYGIHTLQGSAELKVKYNKGYALSGQFIGADSDTVAYNELEYVLDDIPKRLKDAEIKLVNVGKKQDVEDEVYKALHQKDIIILAKFVPQEHGRMLLKYQLGELTNSDFIYWYVWRKAKYIEKR